MFLGNAIGDAFWTALFSKMLNGAPHLGDAGGPNDFSISSGNPGAGMFQEGGYLYVLTGVAAPSGYAATGRSIVRGEDLWIEYRAVPAPAPLPPGWVSPQVAAMLPHLYYPSGEPKVAAAPAPAPSPVVARSPAPLPASSPAPSPAPSPVAARSPAPAPASAPGPVFSTQPTRPSEPGPLAPTAPSASGGPSAGGTTQTIGGDGSQGGGSPRSPGGIPGGVLDLTRGGYGEVAAPAEAAGASSMPVGLLVVALAALYGLG